MAVSSIPQSTIPVIIPMPCQDEDFEQMKNSTDLDNDEDTLSTICTWHATMTSASVIHEHPKDEMVAKAQVATLVAIFVITVVGNTCVLVAMTFGKVKMTRMYYFLVHLCISDLMTAFFSVFPQLAWEVTNRFLGGNILCKLVKYLQILGPYLSSYVLTVTAIDRYQAICFPMSNCSWTPTRSKYMIAIAWGVSLLCCIPQLFIFSYQKVPSTDIYDCWGTFIQPWGERAYVTWYAISVFFLPLVILVFTYVSICVALWENLRRKSHYVSRGEHWNVSSHGGATDARHMTTTKFQEGAGTVLVLQLSRSHRFGRRPAERVEVCLESEDQSSNNSRAAVMVVPRSHSTTGMSRAKIKTVKLTVVVIACYVICSSPFICVQLWAYWYPRARESSVWRGPTVSILMLLASLNSCANPWIYMAFNPSLIRAMREIWHRCWHCNFPRARYQSHRGEQQCTNNRLGQMAPGGAEVIESCSQDCEATTTH